MNASSDFAMLFCSIFVSSLTFPSPDSALQWYFFGLTRVYLALGQIL